MADMTTVTTSTVIPEGLDGDKISDLLSRGMTQLEQNAKRDGVIPLWNTLEIDTEEDEFSDYGMLLDKFIQKNKTIHFSVDAAKGV